MERNNPILSIVVPIYNEAQLIQELHQRLSDAALKITQDYEIVYVNDGSQDQSLSLLKNIAKEDPHTFYINFSRNFGHQIAVTAGLDNCKGKAAVIIDGDLQDPPEIIPELYEKYKEGYEVVYAKRKKRRGESWFKKITARLFYRLMRRSTKIDIPVDVGDFRIIDQKVVQALKQMPEQNKFLRGQIAWLGFRSSEVLFERDERKAGKTGYSFSKMYHFAMDGITSFSDKPLTAVTKTGLIVSFIAFLIILYALYSHFVLDRTITGWTSLIISSMFIGGIQLISIGIIGEYISRINKNVLQRPTYIVSETNLEQER